MSKDKLHWYGCYGGGWEGEIVSPAFAHPAKYGRLLIARIYDYAIERGYLRAGDNVIDPFGGVALGALDAIKSGINWTGVELESEATGGSPFVELGNQNIALWNERYSRYFADLGKPYGTARLLQGDSRRLAELVGVRAEMCVSSPPYAETAIAAGSKGRFGNHTDTKDLLPQIGYSKGYGDNPGQLGAMPEGSFDSAIQGADAVVSSPPYAASMGNGGASGIDKSRYADKTKGRPEWSKNSQAEIDRQYGDTVGQLGSMPEGSFTAAISSPPYSDAINGSGEGPGARFDRTHHAPDNANKRSNGNAYGNTPGNLGNYAAAVSSPPFERSIEGVRTLTYKGDPRKGHYKEGQLIKGGGEYGDTPGNIGNDQGNDFWSAARLIVEQVYTVLRPGGHAIFVTGDFVRDGRRVYFGQQWLDLCTAVGFTFEDWIVAHKQESKGVQLDIFGGEVERTVDRVSFFRRLANERNPEAAILNEDVLIVRKP